ncbi:hypothetical protein V1J52_02450 [Streptomyces sp. TRM 70351]|uniref:hypothetical protein n=1 Tax=Streptomyces sp. TRM 70351 TaxID=3116552 RepID=UPI002E7BC71A|nr:hypothetical protein [Streptomyces sp. TRM 70351]MEE1927051.1 hypothetical protein [Streptomyces sp. TRM 70351]
MRARRLLMPLALLLALAFCAVAGWTDWRARADDDLAHARARDAALADGRRHIARLHTLDGRDVEAGLAGWLAATTGPLHEELKRTGGESGAVLEQEGTTARGTVTDAAVTALDTRTGTAEVIASVRVELTPRGQEPTTDRKRCEATLTRTADGWKLTTLTAVPVAAG